MQYRLFLFFIVTLANISLCRSQVTIGITNPPASGALLDLKSQEGTTSSTKGLGLPRVQLKAPNVLFPMFDDDDEDYLNNKDEFDKIHIGLILYNTNECLFNGYGEGIYVWDQKWNFLGNKKVLNDLLSYTDQEGNEFKARRFGDAGVWMIQNLNVKTYADGTALQAFEGLYSDSKGYYAYPNYKVGGWSSKMPVELSPNGVLYNIKATVRTYYNTSDVDQGQVAGDTPGGNEVEVSGGDGKDSRGYYYIQGICPNGWRIPSDRDWNNLEKELYNNADQYSSYTKEQLPGTSTWDSSWDTQEGIRGSSSSNVLIGQGAVMKSVCLAYGYNTITKTNGTSLLLIQGGFDAPLVGLILSGLNAGYGKDVSFPSSSSKSSKFTIWGRQLSISSGGVNRRERTRSHMFSVRCVLNE